MDPQSIALVGACAFAGIVGAALWARLLAPARAPELSASSPEALAQAKRILETADDIDLLVIKVGAHGAQIEELRDEIRLLRGMPSRRRAGDFSREPTDPGHATGPHARLK